MSTATAAYPCCGGPCRLTLDPTRPRHAVERRHYCHPADEIGTFYRVTTNQVSDGTVTITRVTFLDLASDIAFTHYGTRRVTRRRVREH